MRKSLARVLLLFIALLSPLQAKPNIVIIMVDDMGFSDLACYGGEIDTPAINKLAANGLRFTQFYNCGRCCPTRASLLTGNYPHRAGIGFVTAQNFGKKPEHVARLIALYDAWAKRSDVIARDQLDIPEIPPGDNPLVRSPEEMKRYLQTVNPVLKKHGFKTFEMP